MFIPKGYAINSKMCSKKNQVYLLDHCKPTIFPEHLVLKIYDTQASFNMEYRWLHHLFKHHVNAPKVIASGSNWIIMDYISGVTLTEKITEFESIHDVSLLKGKLQSIVVALTHWLYHFHQASKRFDFPQGTSWCHGDLNGRNLLYQPHGFFGLDFENCHPGYPEKDIALLFIYILTCTPPMTITKQTLVWMLKESLRHALNLDQSRLYHAMQQTVSLLQKRRGNLMPNLQAKDIYHLLS